MEQKVLTLNALELNWSEPALSEIPSKSPKDLKRMERIFAVLRLVIGQYRIERDKIEEDYEHSEELVGKTVIHRVVEEKREEFEMRVRALTYNITFEEKDLRYLYELWLLIPEYNKDRNGLVGLKGNDDVMVYVAILCKLEDLLGIVEEDEEGVDTEA